MYEEKDYGFSWIGLFVKVIIVVIFILLVIWLVSKLFFKYSNKDLKKDMELMEKAAGNYFTADKVPENVGKSSIITLDEMLEKKLIASESISTCDKDESYAKITKYQDYYMLKVELLCGEKEDSTTKKFVPKTKSDDKSLKNEDNDSKSNDNKESDVENNLNKSENKNIANKSNSSANNSETVTKKKIVTEKVVKTLYYEYAKVKYTNVTREYTNYCAPKTETKNYYSLPYLMINNYKVGYNFSYDIKFLDLPSNVSNARVSNVRIYTSLNDFNNYVNNRGKQIAMVGQNNTYTTSLSASTYKKYSLTGGFTPSVNYNSSSKTASITINIDQVYSNVSAYNNMLNIPFLFTLTYNTPDTSKCVVDLSTNSYKYNGYYKTGSWYSNITIEDGLDYSDTKWSSASSLDGYKKTGKSEYR